MRKQVLFGAALLALGTAVVSSCSKDEVVIDNTPGVETPVAEGEQEIILQVANTGDELTSRAGRPLYSAEAKQNIDNVFIMIVSKSGDTKGKVVKANLIENWMQVSADYSTNGHGKQYTWKLSGKDVLAAGNYFVYAIGYSNNSSYQYNTSGTIADYVEDMTTSTPNFAKFTAKLANIKAEEFFAGEIAAITVGDGGEFELTANQTANVLTLHRQVTGVTGYYINVPTTTVENRGNILTALEDVKNGTTNKTTYNNAIKNYKLRLVSSNCSNEIVAAAFNSSFTTTGENIDYVVNGHAVETKITADAGFKGEVDNTRYTVYEITLGDWFPNGDVNGDGILGEEDYNLDADNWRKPTSMGNEAVGFQPGSVFGAEFLIPFLKTANTKTLELQLVGAEITVSGDSSKELEAGVETILRTWNINLASDDDQLGKDPQNGRKVYIVDWTQISSDVWDTYQPKQVGEDAYAENRESYSLVRNHLYSVGEKATDEWNPDKDEPQDLSTGQNLILRVNDNWELIHKMEVE